MDARPRTQYKTLPVRQRAARSETVACVESVEQVGVKWTLAVLALLGTIFTLMLTPAVFAVILMLDAP
jgi:hypothetical protein